MAGYVEVRVWESLGENDLGKEMKIEVVLPN